MLVLVAAALFQTPQPVALGATATGTLGLVTSDERLATEVGVATLRKGGNAIDAAVATAFALAVVQPAAGNLGGGGFLLVRFSNGRTAFLDFREVAPKLASRNMYQSEAESLRGLKAAGVPGSVPGLFEAHRRYGRLRWSDLVEPARKLAAEGFAVSESLSGSLRAREASNLLPAAQAAYLPGGKAPAPGALLRLPQLATVLERIRDRGAKGFTEGETAREIAADMKARGGLITEADLKAYRPKWRTPLKGTYRGHEVLTAPPPSSGGVALLQMLKLREAWPADLSPADDLHITTEAMRRAFADRAAYLGDPDFVPVPVKTLLSKRYLDGRRATMRMDRQTDVPASPSRPGRPESTETLHFSVLDSSGNAVALTTTLNGSYGCGDLAGGVLMNNEMDDFAARPGMPNMYGLIQGEANTIAPGKRPLSSMTPTIVSEGGKVRLIVGSPGGPTIINTVMQVIRNVVDRKMGIREAVDAGRVHHQWRPDVLDTEPGAVPPAVLESLRSRGHQVRPRGIQGVANCIEVLPDGRRIAVADTRRRKSAWADRE